MIRGIVHSIDNPYRLNTFLDSWRTHASDSISMTVMYQDSDADFERGYSKLMDKYKNVNFIQTSEPKQTMFAMLKECEETFTALFTDEDMFYHKVNKGGEEIIEEVFESHKDLLAFSLRLGRNVTVNKQFGSPNTIIPLNDQRDNHLLVDWSKHYLDFGFPLCVHGHVFRTKEIRKLANKVRWKHFDELQENLNEVFDRFPKKKMASFNRSVIVTDVAPPSQTADVLTRKILNLRWLDDKILPVPIKKSKVDAITYNFGVYAWLLKDKKTDEKQPN